MRLFYISGLALCSTIASLSLGFAESIPAKYKQGSMHGLLLLKTMQGEVIGTGDQVSVFQGTRVCSRLTFHFRDGSIDDETTVFKQETVLQLISDHHIQKGPSFPQPLDLAVNVITGALTWRENKHGKEEIKTEHMDLPQDLANGLLAAVLMNMPSAAPEVKISYLTVTTKPRVVQLSVTPDGKDQCRLGGSTCIAQRFKIHIELGGFAGIVAPFIGKQPSDIKVWMMEGEVPAFIRMEGPLYPEGPIWTAELAAPVWPFTRR